MLDPSLFENRIEDTKDNDCWLTTKEAAEYLRVSEGTLANMTSNGNVPYYKLGRRNRYLLSELKSLLLSERIGGKYGI